MDRTGLIFTLGLWSVKARNEEAFKSAWERFAKWTSRNQPGALEAYLLQDAEEPRRFISFGPWKDADSIRAWRQRPEFKEFFARAKTLCDEIQPRTLKTIVYVQEK